MRDYWVSTKAFTCLVTTDKNNIITETASILKKFINQDFYNLKMWLENKFTNIKIERID